MNNSIGENTIVTRKLIPDDQRLSHIEKLFGVHFPSRLEPVIYGITERMAEAYSGGYWQFYSLDNGGFYMAPESSASYHVRCNNFWEGSMSGDALGVVSCLYAYSHLSFGGPEAFARECARHYHLLREFMYDHSEMAGILGAVD